MRRGMVGVMAVVAGVLAAPGSAFASGPRHVPSPDWRDQIIYFVMTDRFDDGDSRNNDQGTGEYDPARRSHYSGGDLAGVVRRLDYIRGLGATAVWITPPVAHQWWNRRVDYGGYHGYWAEDFSRVDPHYGSLDDYRRLATELHGRGMYLVQDVVVNHMADYFGYGPERREGDPLTGYRLLADGRGRTAPTQPPFHLNDPRRPQDRAAGIYHWTPEVRDYTDPVQEKTWQMSGLDDLDTSNPAVREALRASYGMWIREVGVDAFRVDTAFYVPPEYFRDFLEAGDARAPGVLHVARATGRRDFHVFGEGFGIDRAFEDIQARRIESYARDASGRPLLPAMINFPLYGGLQDVLARGRPTTELADRIERMMRVHADPHRMPTFLDNHDVDRFLAAGSDAALRQGLLMLMTLPGIPTIYYGTEQGFTQPRASMFAAGFGAGGRDRFDMQSDGYRYLQRVAQLRRGNRVLSRGRPAILASNPTRPGVLAFRMDHEGEAALVVINTAGSAVLLDRLSTGLPAGSRLAPVFAIDGEAPAAREGAPLVLPGRSGYVWRVEDAPGGTPAASGPVPGHALEIDPIATVATGSLAVTGRARPGAEVRLVVDGDLAHAVRARADGDGRWAVQLRTDDLVDPAVVHRLVAYDPIRGTVSDPHSFASRPDWQPVAGVDDPRGDDRGPTGRYRYPLDPGWGAHHQGDLEHVAARASGGSLQLDVRLRSITRSWNPANGFDHVALTVYVELPGMPGGLREMPLQDARLPGRMRWHRRLRIGGWSNLLSSTDGAGPAHEGAPVSPGAALSVDTGTRTLRLMLPASALGSPTTLDGARVYVTTWDYDGGYRALAPEAGSHVFGGAAPGDAKVLDDVLLHLRHR